MSSTASTSSHFPLHLLIAASVWLLMAVAGGEVATYTAAPRATANSVQTPWRNVEPVAMRPRSSNDPRSEIIGSRPLFFKIISHNLFVYVLLLSGLVAWGIPTLLTTASNAWLFGGLIATAIAKGVDPVVIAMVVLPHGILEITGFILGGAVGLHGWRYAKVALSGQEELVSLSASRLWVYGAAGVVLLIMAAVIESSITRQLVVTYFHS
jgi:uncharacterized membrane protein SpoIIM required for sporulation